MARKKRQGGSRRPSATEEVESVPDVKELLIGRSNLNQCVHYACKSTELKRILERIKSSLPKVCRCQLCNGEVIPPMKRNVEFSESTLRWACLDCEEAFCGGLDNFGPNGDIVTHSLFSGHTLCTLVDRLSLAWCFECDQQNTTGEEEEEEEEEDEGVELAMDVEEEAKEMIQPEVDNPNICDHFTSTKLKQILERIKSSSRCQKCGEEVKMDPGKPPMKRKELPSDSTFLWVCFDCEKTFCGDMGAFGPNGHVNDHAAPDCHQLCTRLDMPSKVWCYICNDEVDLATGVKSEQKGTMQQEVDNAVFESGTEFIVKNLHNKELNCYFNSVIQNPFAMGGLWERLASLEQSGTIVTKELKGHFDESFDDSINIINPLDLGKVLCEGEFLPSVLYPWDLPQLKGSHELLIHLPENQESKEKEFVNNAVSESKTGFVVKKLPNKELNCYFNSVLQNLFAMDRLRQRLASLEQPSGSVTKELKRHFAESCDDSIETLNPLELRKLLRKKDAFLPGVQEDSHELLVHLLEKLESEEKEFVNELFHGELFSDMRCTRCGNISRKAEGLGVLSLELPKDNAPPAREGYTDQVKGTVKRPLIDELDEANESDNPQTSSNYPEGSDSYDSLCYNLPGASDSSDAAPDSDLATLADLTGKRCVSKHRNSSNGKVDMNRCKEDSNVSIMVSDHKISIGKVVGTDIGVVESDVVCEADNMNGLSIERCLDLYTKSENMPDASCNSCSPESQRQQKPSEKTDIQEDGVKSESKKASGLPGDISDQKNVGQDGHNLAAAPGSSQDDPETKLVKATKRLLIKRPPHIVVIHLKRSTLESGITEKNEDHVIFKEKLDLSPYVDHSSGKDEQHIYHLTGVVVHEGSSTMAGHYFAFVRWKTSQGGTAWFKADDDKVPGEVSLETVLRSEAYMLFFERVDNTL